VLRRIEAQRHDQCSGRKRADGFFRDADRLYVAVIASSFRQRNIEIGAETGTRTTLVGIAPDERVEEGSVSVDRHREHVGPFVEDALRAIAVMNVDIEDRHALMLQAQMRRCDRAVVEETEATGQIAIGVMARRTTKRIGGALAVHHELRRRRRHVGGRASRSPGAGPDRTGCIDRVPAEPPDDVGRVGRGVAHRMHVGNHLRPGIAKRGPGIPGLAEKAEIFRTVNSRTRALPEHVWRNQIVLAGLEPRKQPVGAFGLFGGALDDTANQKELRIVAAVQFSVDGLHANTPVRRT